MCPAGGTACGRRTYSSISWPVTLGDSSASPAATTAAPTGHGRKALGAYTQALRDLLGGL